MKLELSKTDTINSKNICMVDSGTKSIHLRKMVRTLRDEDLFNTIEDFVKQGGEQGSGAIPVFSEDLSKTALSLQANGYRGTRKFRTFSGDVKAFNSTIAKGESVDVVVTDSLIYDKGFDYGFVRNGVAYSQNGGQITAPKAKQSKNLMFSGHVDYNSDPELNIATYDNGVYNFNNCDDIHLYSKLWIVKGLGVTLQAGTYTISSHKNIEDDLTHTVIYQSSKVYASSAEMDYKTTITLDSEKLVVVAIGDKDENTPTNLKIYVQIEEGDTATDWVAPLIDGVYTLQLPSETLKPTQSGDDWLVPAKDEESNDGLLNLTTLEFTAV